MTDHILHSPGVLSQETCSNVINTFEHNKELQQEGRFGAGVLDHELKKCTEMFIEYKRDTDFYLYVVKYLKASIEEYKQVYPYIDKLAHWEILETFKIQKQLNVGAMQT